MDRFGLVRLINYSADLNTRLKHVGLPNIQTRSELGRFWTFSVQYYSHNMNTGPKMAEMIVLRNRAIWKPNNSFWWLWNRITWRILHQIDYTERRACFPCWKCVLKLNHNYIDFETLYDWYWNTKKSLKTLKFSKIVFNRQEHWEKKVQKPSAQFDESVVQTISFGHRPNH